MAKLSMTITAAVASALLASAAALAAMSHSPQQQTIQSLVGSWRCANHMGTATQNESDTDSMYGSWLKIDASYTGGGESAYTGVSYLGYDSKNHRWVITSADEHGGYSIGYSNSANLNGSVWHDGYPADNGTGSFHMTRSTSFSFNGMFPGAHGKMISTHSVCTRTGG